MKMEVRKPTALGALLVAGLWMGTAGAVSVTVTIDEGHLHEWTWNDGAVSGSHGDAGVWDFAWSIDSASNPFIQVNSLSFTNTSSATQSYLITLNGPVATSYSQALVTDASMGYSWESDGNIEISNVQWQGTINGVTVSSIFGSGINIDSGTTPLNGTVSTMADPSVPFLHDAGGTITSLGMIFSFDLSTGDTIDFNALLDITPVPVPAAAWLFGSGLFGLVGLARRRRALSIR